MCRPCDAIKQLTTSHSEMSNLPYGTVTDGRNKARSVHNAYAVRDAGRRVVGLPDIKYLMCDGASG